MLKKLENNILFFIFTCRYLRWFFRLFMTERELSIKVVRLFEEFIMRVNEDNDKNDLD